DGAPVHRATVSRHWRETHHLEKLDWPEQSPDLNPIENLWSFMKPNIQARNPRVNSLGQMCRVVQEEWENLMVDSWRQMVESMPSRMAAVISNKGGSVRW